MADGVEIVDPPAAPESGATCPICMDTLGAPINIRVTKRRKKVPVADEDCWRLRCSHQYCIGCLSGWIESKVKDRAAPITCCNTDCKREIRPSHVAAVISPELFEQFSQLVTVKATEDESIYCPNKECSQMFLKPAIRAGQEQTSCPICKTKICIRCQVGWHDGLTCDAYKRMVDAGGDQEQAQLMALKEKMSWKQCPKCSMLVERSMGCNFMRCKCGEHFCYACGVPYANRIPTRENPHGKSGCSCGLFPPAAPAAPAAPIDRAAVARERERMAQRLLEVEQMLRARVAAEAAERAAAAERQVVRSVIERDARVQRQVAQLPRHDLAHVARVAQAHGIPNDWRHNLPEVPHAFPNAAPVPVMPNTKAKGKAPLLSRRHDVLAPAPMALRSHAASAPATKKKSMSKAHKRIKLPPVVGHLDAPRPDLGAAGPAIDYSSPFPAQSPFCGSAATSCPNYPPAIVCSAVSQARSAQHYAPPSVPLFVAAAAPEPRAVRFARQPPPAMVATARRSHGMPAHLLQGQPMPVAAPQPERKRPALQAPNYAPPMTAPANGKAPKSRRAGKRTILDVSMDSPTPPRAKTKRPDT
ncbi:hypothetical protein SDRG_01745 [Saprolegnia diclina VS20]|uniref:RBR-type E3 ubiquitin transferase n=1 Tax=Saprolegnia diclina (strain VS20) TaxID=1156394 RepID=T0SCS6_SAPDV|nr:hypothetical protein SDRG_01745 [Saprolegnia diclina VS20]EQC40667.1 hypothetical protein SDRG_01745 [Saprolegnia diclina VS20]|eukprot:XP_008605511.1 hypothetical protein SDRG_01745 [Saprolegnia diclina VS20]